MFKKSAACPDTKKKVSRPSECNGVRIDGALKNACASCNAYKAYVQKTIK